MNNTLKRVIAALALSALATNAMAQAKCAQPQDVVALRAAGMQQKLMVAALSCDAIPQYNRFVTAYQGELQAADRNLQAFFRCLNPRTGTSDYHAYKTKLANGSSMNSIGDMRAFCEGAASMFATALDAGKQTLAAFMSTQPEQNDANYGACPGQGNRPVSSLEERTAEPPEVVPTPWEKPAMLAYWRPPLTFFPGNVLDSSARPGTL